MTGHNDITGDSLISKPTSKEYEEGWDRIFKKKPNCLDSAYERLAMKQGLNNSPVFPENQKEQDY